MESIGALRPYRRRNVKAGLSHEISPHQPTNGRHAIARPMTGLDPRFSGAGNGCASSGSTPSWARSFVGRECSGPPSWSERHTRTVAVVCEPPARVRGRRDVEVALIRKAPVYSEAIEGGEMFLSS